MVMWAHHSAEMLLAALMVACPPPAASLGAAAVGISFNSSFGSYMVLQQQPAKACVFGQLGEGGSAATVRISGTGAAATAFEPYEVHAEVSGSAWKACLNPAAAGGSHTLTATCTGCTNTSAAVIEHVTFGDVWYCGGQVSLSGCPPDAPLG